MVYNDLITYNEYNNEGDKIYTYFDDVVGAMEAFGHSAYLATKMVKDVLCLWDDKLELPCAILRKEQMEELMNKGDVDAYVSNAELTLLNLAQPIVFDNSIYDKWLEVLKARKMKVMAPLPLSDMLEDRSLESNMDCKECAACLGMHTKSEIVVVAVTILFSLLAAALIYFLAR